jgi:hypothetical protein
MSSVIRDLLIISVALLLMNMQQGNAQVSDVSDGYWSIVVPSASALDVDMGQVIVHQSSELVVPGFVANTGTVPITIEAIVISGGDAGEFALASALTPFILDVGESRAVGFRFSPASVGMKTAMLYVHTQVDTLQHSIRGEGTREGAMAVLGLDTIRARAGELVELPLYLRDQQNLANSGATGFRAELRLNASLLAPTGTTPHGSIQDGERTIVLENIPLQADSRQVLTTLEFIAMLGDAESTTLELHNLSATGGNVLLSDIPGLFLLTDICREGGVRLYHALGEASLRQNRPNPFNMITVIDYAVVESGYTRLIVMDILGKPIAVLVDDILEAGSYSTIFDASGVTSGTYLYVLQTPSERILRLMEVVK